jgi:hypothetical protein
MDVGWVAAAGVDPIPLLRAHRHRFRLMLTGQSDSRTGRRMSRFSARNRFYT